ncbi:epoxide hydrolase (plasmid) [Arthrobacter sp. D3-18]
MITPYKIDIPEDLIRQTRERVRQTRWPVIPQGESTRYGASIPYLKNMLSFWAEEYSWRAWEQKLNSRPHFLTEIDGVDIHFWHIRGAKPGSVPLLLLHGWPGSPIEYWDLIGPLTDPAAHGAPDAPSFDVVIAELPGFGFSGKPVDAGWGPERMANALHELMHDVLEYPTYAVHGEDWGTLIGARIARLHPNEVAALHITMPFTGPYGDFVPTPEWGGRMYEATGYLHVQSLVPDALTLGMADSPLGLAAWVLEKFSAWSDSSGDLDAAFSRDILLTNLHFYWLTGSIVSSTRLYRESALEGGDVIGPPQIPVPTAVAAFPAEPFASPREWLEGVYNIARYSEFESGGHFAALEKPEIVLDEIRAFFPAYFGENA